MAYRSRPVNRRSGWNSCNKFLSVDGPYDKVELRNMLTQWSVFQTPFRAPLRPGQSALRSRHRRKHCPGPFKLSGAYTF